MRQTSQTREIIKWFSGDEIKFFLKELGLAIQIGEDTNIYQLEGFLIGLR